MNSIIDFFLSPYAQAGFLDILLEIIAVCLGIMSVVYAKKNSVLVYPTGIVSTVIYVYICYHSVLYGDLIVNVYYTLMSIYGWYMWSKIDEQKQHIGITQSGVGDWLKALGIFSFTAIFVIFVYRYYQIMPDLDFSESVLYAFDHLTSGNLENFREATPFLDTFTTGIFFTGMWLMANKKIEHWLFWIFGNIVSVPLYFVKGLGFTGIQFTIFLVLAVQGYFAWKKLLKKANAESK